VPLPVQDDFKNISFQIENLETFSIDFDIFPTFGSKVIARSAASSRVFTGNSSSSGKWHLELFDPRLRAIGRIAFRYQVITPFRGGPLEITHFATYWKATSQFDNHPSNLITGSSLSGDFLRLFVQVTKDGVPVLFPEWSTPASKNDLISRLTYEEFQAAVQNNQSGNGAFDSLLEAGIDSGDLPAAQRQIARSHASLKEALAILPADLNLELHVCYPTRNMEEKLQLGPTQNINFVVDAVLLAVFDHARQLRESKENPLRNFVFSSYNPDVCAALNWKQPNCEYPCHIKATKPVLTTYRSRPALQRTRRRTSHHRERARPQHDRQLRSHRHVYQRSRPNRTVK
jgi:CDK inhibitor PHO81